MKLTNRELQIMEYLWNNGGSFVKDIVTSFDTPRPHYNTISTIVRKLEEKGSIGHIELGGTFKYHASVSKEEFVARNLKTQIKKYFNNSYQSLVSYLVENKEISVEEIQELIKLSQKEK
ncbi:MAG: BlaI/MecI/CopY family transcriptional regulator [Bacteroidales bacterium]|nr:BlaI/MecI/CopY family transcriptional regulator [Bacteroidales bacterium]